MNAKKIAYIGPNHPKENCQCSTIKKIKCMTGIDSFQAESMSAISNLLILVAVGYTKAENYKIIRAPMALFTACNGSRPKNKCQFECTYVHKKKHHRINVHWIHIFSTFWHGIICQLMTNTINLPSLHKYWLSWTQLSKMGPLFKISVILTEKWLYVQVSFSQKMANFRSFHEQINVSASLSR